MSRGDRILVGVLWILACVRVLAHDWTLDADAWEWMAVLREAAERPIHPGHPIVEAPGSLSSRYTPAAVAGALACRWLGLGPRSWMDLQGCAAALALMTGLMAFCRRRWKEPAMGRYALLAVLFLWGRGWDWSGELAWSTLSKTWTYPVTLALAVALWGAVAAMRWLDGEGARFGGLAALALAACVTTHPETGAFACLLGLLLCVEPWRPSRALPVLLACAAAWGAAFAWPYFSLKDMILEGLKPGWIERNSNFYSWHLWHLGPGLLGLLAAFRFARDRREPFLVAGIVSLSLVYAVAGLQNGELGRILFFLVLFLHLAAARLLLEWRVLSLDALRRPAALALGLWVLGAAIHLRWTPGLRLDEALSPAAACLGPGDVVAGEGPYGWPLPALTGCRNLGLLHHHSLQRDQHEREAAAAELVAPGTPPARREALAGIWGVTHVLLRDGIDARFGREVARLGPLPGRKPGETLTLTLARVSARARPRP